MRNSDVDGERGLLSLKIVAGLICFLFVLFCARVWGLGPMHTDDGLWELYAFRGTDHPVRNLAAGEARLWAFVGAPQILLGLRFQDTPLGECLRYGSFLAFAGLFYAMVWRYFSARIALMAATFFVAWTVVRFEGSILVTYPIYTWTAGAAFMASALCALTYQETGKVLWLAIAGLGFGFSLITQEGVSALLFVLFPLLVAVSATRGARTLGDWARAATQRRQLLLLAVWGTVTIAYAVPAVAWSLLHPTTYAGRTFAPFDLRKIVTVLSVMATRGSALSDIVAPYQVNYVDVVFV